VEFKDNIIYLTPDEVDYAFCPANPKWARSQIEAYGLARCARSEKLKSLLSCTELLKSLGLDYVVMEAEAEPEAVEPVAVEPEAVEPEVVEVAATLVPPAGFCHCPPVGD